MVGLTAIKQGRSANRKHTFFLALEEAVLLSTHDICSNGWIRKYLHIYNFTLKNFVYLNLCSRLTRRLCMGVERMTLRLCDKYLNLMNWLISFHEYAGSYTSYFRSNIYFPYYLLTPSDKDCSLETPININFQTYCVLLLY